LIAAQQDGTAIAPNKISVAAFIDRFESDWVANHVTARSAERYRAALGHVRRHLGDRLLQKLCPADLAGLYAALKREGLQPRTVKFVGVILYSALRQAKKWGIIRDNPAETEKPPKAPQRETEMLQPKEAAALLQRLHGKPLYLLASLALATGARRNELLGLRWQDLDLDNARLTIAQALEQTAAHGIQVKAPKTKHSKRTIALPPHAVAELRAHWRAQQEQRLALGMGKAPEGFPVLATYDGTYQSPNAVSHAWVRQMAALESSVTLHSLRHTHGSMLIASGVLGHSSVKVTLDVYGHLIHGTDDKAAEIIGRAFG